VNVYLDMCAIQRPLDTKNQVRIAVDAEAVLGIIALCESGALELVSSDALVFELGRNPNPIRRQYAEEVLSLAKSFIDINESLERRADALSAMGVKPLDALHLAAAEEAQADYFCTCDDRLLKKAQSLKDLRTRVVTPVELIEEIQA